MSKWLQEAENPELVALRVRRLYEQQGYSRRWVDKRWRGISARQELTSEWHQRGAEQSDDYRALTNELLHSAFGMDVEGYRRYKNLLGSLETSAKDRNDETTVDRASRRGAGDGSPAEGDAATSRAKRSPDRGGPATARSASEG